MERHREGRPLPGVLPSSIVLDLPPTGQPANVHNAVSWGNPPGLCRRTSMLILIMIIHLCGNYFVL